MGLRPCFLANCWHSLKKTKAVNKRETSQNRNPVFHLLARCARFFNTALSTNPRLHNDGTNSAEECLYTAASSVARATLQLGQLSRVRSGTLASRLLQPDTRNTAPPTLCKYTKKYFMVGTSCDWQNCQSTVGERRCRLEINDSVRGQTVEFVEAGL